MNMKNSKFFKRIQQLRRMSKEKMRRERARVDEELANALQERDGNYHKLAVKQPPHVLPVIHGQEEPAMPTKTRMQESAADTAGIIQLNNLCFRLKCTHPRHSSQDDELPTVSSIKGSICVTNSRYPMIGKVSRILGYKVVKESKMWNVLWMDTMPGVEVYKNMKRFQQINHFPGMLEICRKDLLSRNLNRMLKLFPNEYKIFPKTWIFPADYGEALNFATNAIKGKPRTFIIKPDSGAQGRGIWLTNDLKTINPAERMICQTYISKPLLIDGYKFDLRVYTLLTSVDPLRIFVYNEGLARFATNKYVEPTPDNSADLFMHLTNYSVNKRNSQYDLCDNDDCGSKRKFSAINNWMRSRNHNVNEFWAKIDDIIIKTVLSAWPMLKHNYHACFPSHDKIQACFEILGFDILVDSKLKPYILEVNHSPSFHTNEQVDRQVKRALIRDTLSLVSTVLADKRKILKEDRKRVKQRLLNTKQGDPSTDAEHKAPQSHLSSLAQQVAWEESHLGDFRRIMPPTEPDRLNYYCQFYALQNQASIYGDTAASKKREDLAKKTRMQLEEKKKKQEQLLKNGHMSFDERRKKRSTVPREVLDRQRLMQRKLAEAWTPDFISEAEERLRRSWMQVRTAELKEWKILELVFMQFYQKGDLTNADILNYPDLYRSLENGVDILTEDSV